MTKSTEKPKKKPLTVKERAAKRKKEKSAKEYQKAKKRKTPTTPKIKKDPDTPIFATRLERQISTPGRIKVGSKLGLGNPGMGGTKVGYARTGLYDGADTQRNLDKGKSKGKNYAQFGTKSIKDNRKKGLVK